VNKHSLQVVLKELPVPEIHYFETIGSTNDGALALSKSGAEDGTLVVADSQTSGRGRAGRRWITNAGTGLAFSIILRPDKEEAEKIVNDMWLKGEVE